MNKHHFYFIFYKFFHAPLVRLVRGVLYVSLIAVILLTFLHYIPVNIPVAFLYCIFIMSEIFILFHINPMLPYAPITESEGHYEESMMFIARELYINKKTSYEIMESLLKLKGVTYFLLKLAPEFKPTQQEIEKSELLIHAVKLVQTLNGKYITGIDLFAAYILMSEPQTKFLQSHDLREDDLLHILYWARHHFFSERGKKINIQFTGYGIFDSLIYGWNYEVKKYAVDFTEAVMSERYEPIVVGRDKEYQNLLTVLSKDTSNDVLLVGEMGTGKTSLIKQFAYESHLGKTPHHLSHRKIFEILTDRLLAGINVQGDLETRLDSLFSEIEHSGNVIIFMQNIENIFGGGGFQFDISGVIFELLKSGHVQFIGTTTPSSYKTFIENKKSIKSFFELIRFEEPDQTAALLMIFEKARGIENKYNLDLTYSAIKEAVILSASYLPDQYLPGKAINLLENIASTLKMSGKKIMEKTDVISFIEQKTKVVLSEPTKDEKSLLLHLEDTIHKRLIDQQEAVGAVATAMRRLRSGFINNKRPISSFLFLGPTGVGKTELAKALAAIYFGDEQKMIRVDMSEYQTQDSLRKILGNMPGEEIMGDTLVEKVRQDPFSLILLDEFEKAHPHLLDIFLQVFDDGRLTDNAGRTISFVNTIIIATSNAGAEFIYEKIKAGEPVEQFHAELVDNLLKSQIFKPELINRFDEVVIFKPLTETDAAQVSKLMLEQALKPLEDQELFITSDDKAIQKIGNEGFSAEFGARNLRRYIQNSVEDFISKLILEEKLPKGTHGILSVDEKGVFVIKDG